MITVIGSLNIDLSTRVERLPKPGETVRGSGFARAPGGKGANQALAARRAGGAVKMIGAIGRDAFGEEAVALLKEAGVNLSGLARTSEPTGTAIIFVDGAGENVIAINAGANGRVTQAKARSVVETMKKGDHLLLQLETPADTVETALAAGRSHGIRSVLNTAPFTPSAARLAALADIVVTNESEFAALETELGEHRGHGRSLEERIARAAGTLDAALVVTLGSRGVTAFREGKSVSATGLSIEPVDTVGAGDTFCGYLTAALDEGLEFAAALRLAAVAGSMACLVPGAQPSIPLRKDVEKRR